MNVLAAMISISCMMTLKPCSGDGLKFLDLSVGSGDEVSKGKRVVVSPGILTPSLYSAPFNPCQPLPQMIFLILCALQVHFDCIYRGVNVVSSRQARLLGGNRTISEVTGLICSRHVFCAALAEKTCFSAL